MLLPLAGLAFFGARSSLEKWRTYRAYVALDGNSAVLQQIGQAVHELQKERGRSAGLLGSKGTQFAAELRDQRTLSDQTLAELDAALTLGTRAAAITMMLGSIPQQDVFQRVMSAKDEKTARNGAMIGGISYILFAAVPMFIVASSLLIMPEQTAELLKDDPQKVLPTLVMERMPLILQVAFFGALLRPTVCGASYYGHHGFSLELYAIRAQCQINSAGIPKARV